MSRQKFIKNAKKVNLASVWKPKACGQTVLPDRSIIIVKKLAENSKNPKFKWDILGRQKFIKTVWPDRPISKISVKCLNEIFLVIFKHYAYCKNSDYWASLSIFLTGLKAWKSWDKLLLIRGTLLMWD